MENNTGQDRRKHTRYEFAYPVEFKLFSPQLQSTYINGFIENISVQGACIQFGDKYGRINPEDLSGSRVKLSIVMPDGDSVSLLSLVRWKSGNGPESFFLRMGMEFDEIGDWQTESINNLIGMKNKDINMMWGLWDQFNRYS